MATWYPVEACQVCHLVLLALEMLQLVVVVQDVASLYSCSAMLGTALYAHVLDPFEVLCWPRVESW